MRRVKLIKLSDDTFDGHHPNGINEGYTVYGFEVNPPVIGERYYVRHSKMDHYPFSTSNVKTLPDKDGIFKTTYSTYKLTYE